MKLDIYSCEECGNAFGNEYEESPKVCPNCESELWEFSHTVEIKKGIAELVDEAYLTAKSKGWHDEPVETGTQLALIHSEVSEALEADRKGWDGNFAEELADVVIRVFDLCGSKGINLEYHILKKMEYNKTRPHKHGGKAY